MTTGNRLPVPRVITPSAEQSRTQRTRRSAEVLQRSDPAVDHDVTTVEAELTDMQSASLDDQRTVGELDADGLLVKARYILHTGQGEQTAVIERKQMRLFNGIIGQKNPPIILSIDYMGGSKDL